MTTTRISTATWFRNSSCMTVGLEAGWWFFSPWHDAPWSYDTSGDTNHSNNYEHRLRTDFTSDSFMSFNLMNNKPTDCHKGWLWHLNYFVFYQVSSDTRLSIILKRKVNRKVGCSLFAAFKLYTRSADLWQSTQFITLRQYWAATWNYNLKKGRDKSKLHETALIFTLRRRKKAKYSYWPLISFVP